MLSRSSDWFTDHRESEHFVSYSETYWTLNNSRNSVLLTLSITMTLLFLPSNSLQPNFIIINTLNLKLDEKIIPLVLQCAWVRMPHACMCAYVIKCDR